MKIATNHWGWSPRGILRWLRTWAWPIAVWGVEITSQLTDGNSFLYAEDGCPIRVFQRRVKIGPICFALGRYSQRQAS